MTNANELREKVRRAIQLGYTPGATGYYGPTAAADAAIGVVVEACCVQLMATMLKAGVKVIGPGDAVMAIKAMLPEDPTLANKEPTP